MTAQEVYEDMQAGLDATGTDRYLFRINHIPAINWAMDWAVAAFNFAFANTKLSEECLHTLLVQRVFQTSQFARIRLDEAALGHKVWTVASVYAEISVYPQLPVNPTPPDQSLYRSDISIADFGKKVKRVTVEQLGDVRTNRFIAGSHRFMNTPRRSYAYALIGALSSDGYSAGDREIQIEPGPVCGNQFFGVGYLRMPRKVAQLSDPIDFPDQMRNIISTMALRRLAMKQGDGTNLFSITSADAAQLTQLMS